MSKVWFITGSSRGFGREFVRAALERGDRVAATARDVDSLADLVAAHGERILAVPLDVTSSDDVVRTVAQAHQHFGRLDVVVNNAGYGLFGAVEELSENDIRSQMETNFFGALWVTQAALPYLRKQGSGHIVQISSIGGVVAFPALGGYHASKWALEGITESLAQEVARFGIKVTLVEPGSFATDWAGSSATWAESLPPYEDIRKARSSRAANAGDPVAAGPALLEVVDAADPPLRVFFGTMPQLIASAKYGERLKTWEDWSSLAARAQGGE
ncbi:SDR family NAD(P)-dependent oxidoreductase [Actinomadura sp. LD22]|uniref:SDR family NAD(P)-dependent oxidoreductase n=1 Tax=Actinomadura physcomitrii TaxID=2650748 RepID=A0A6I4M763_9ACTN|nr:SDR family NAD(P)-dependent oxidoreductase [Actinomadura physcomitrii]MWA01613.1 SDR family NAD(P)-dependent oxidoreductase [Actinomadura physcomitrii]